ncbi:uncharacterized protein LOC129612520 isoform X2 [Condylostylus longicornis]|uniref:uncharacterized protein LOC129612520 isoform X2 n=1 Tax=Condylostylus longicornis TaxID=2530218 RepID=UPI00244E5A35|nr:uncharacterized protein LOC129612520 isoform X2 [Condylostylus longicornis]
MSGNDYKRLKQEEDEEEEDSVFDPLLKLENDSESSIDIKIKSNRKCQKQQSQEQQHQQILDIQQSTKIVRNKRCDNSTTDKKLNLSENLSHLTKKKRLIVFLVFVILIFCFNSSTIMTWTTTEKIPVLHNSHVPGMKVINFSRVLKSKNNFNFKSNSSLCVTDNTDSPSVSNLNKISNNENDFSNNVLIASSPALLILENNSIESSSENSIILMNNSSNIINDNNKIPNIIRNINFNFSSINDTIYESSIITNTINNDNKNINNNNINNSKSNYNNEIENIKIANKNANKKNVANTLNTTVTTANTTSNSTTSTTTTTTSKSLMFVPPPPSGYLVWSDKCKMPNLDPYSPEVMKYFKRESYEECSKDQPLTSVKFNTTTNRYMLILDENLRYKFTRYGNQLSCCYQVIERNSTGKKADTNTILSACLSFSKTVQLPQTTDNILVKCKSGKKQTYIHGHAMMPERPEIRERIDSWKANDTAKPISVLLLGVDSISRINLIRAMPKTAQYLYDNEWFELSGYNKMDDNTFPNLMAILTGYNYTTGYHICKPITVGKLDKCPMIWKTFRDLGYVTAYGEDETSISTFNYAKVGFEKPPTDYYLRPFLIQAEHNFHKRLKSGLTFCLGYQHSADYVYDYALELATRYKDDPYFGLFWANTFSHNSISDCSSMDLKMVQYLEKFSDRGILNSSVIVFFSDHGMRFGPTRKLLSGHYEERLPFIFIWLPPWLKTKHPELVNALSVNKNRLTNPFDLHMTLKHILELSGRVKNLPKAPDCQNCQTLFKPVPQSRSCDEISIEDHWCTCIPYQSIYKKSTLVKKVSIFAIDYINNYIGAWKNGSIEHLCAKLHLHDVIASYRALLIGDIYPPNLESYRIVFTTNPGGGMFEATIRRFSDNDTLEVTGSISRLNIYASESKCVPDAGIKKYCHCTKHPSSRAAVRSPAG